MNNRGRLVLMMGVVALGLTFGVVAQAQEDALPALPVDAYKKNDKGILVAEVKFAADGTVSSCRILRSNVPFTLEASVVDYIRRKWVNEWLAGDTVHMPITFEELPWYAKHWDDPLVAPPNFLPTGDAGRNVKLRITFGPKGWVQRVKIESPSGVDLLDRETAIWVKVHWHNEAYAGQTVDAPFEFKPVSVPVQPKPVSKPVAPPTPQEIYAPPAQRVE